MKITLFLSLLLSAAFSKADVVLSEKIVNLAMISAQLSAIAYYENPPGDAFDSFGFYDEGV
jgi:hypothetical protein